ncbi:MAG: MBL fold metallo-hydrolase [Myxococcota bacterium]
MKLTILGSADAYNSAGRFHSCYLLEAPGCGPVMIDIGGSGLVALRQSGREPNEIQGLAITHLHGDHLGGLPYLLLDCAYNHPRTATLPLVGPVGLADRVQALYASTYRELHTLPLKFDLPMTEIAPGESATLAGFRIEGFLADHMDPPEQPLSLRIEAPNGQIAAFSGDTAMNPQLLAAAEDVDVLVGECSALKPPIGRHCTWEDWKTVLPNLSTPRVVLSHLNHRVRDEISRLLTEVPPNVDLVFADDGLVLEF